MNMKDALAASLRREQEQLSSDYTSVNALWDMLRGQGGPMTADGLVYISRSHRELADRAAGMRESLFALIDSQAAPLVLDGFVCTPDHAVQVAEMVSNLEAAFGHYPHGDREVLEVFRDYLDGRLDTNEVNQVLYTEWSEAFPGLKAPAPEENV